MRVTNYVTTAKKYLLSWIFFISAICLLTLTQVDTFKLLICFYLIFLSIVYVYLKHVYVDEDSIRIGNDTIKEEDVMSSNAFDINLYYYVFLKYKSYDGKVKWCLVDLGSLSVVDFVIDRIINPGRNKRVEKFVEFIGKKKKQ